MFIATVYIAAKFYTDSFLIVHKNENEPESNFDSDNNVKGDNHINPLHELEKHDVPNGTDSSVNDNSSTGVSDNNSTGVDIDNISTGVSDNDSAGVVNPTNDNTDNKSTGVGNSDAVALEDRDDEFAPPVNDGDNEPANDGDNDGTNNTHAVTCLGRVGRPYDFANSFPAIYGDTNHVSSTSDSFHMHLYYYNDDLQLKLSKGINYSNTFFGENVTMINMETPEYKDNILILGVDEYQLYIEALNWFEFDQDETSRQKGISKYGDKGKASAMKEIQILTQNECFNEVTYEDLMQEMKDRALPILMFMIMKGNGDLKSRGVADGRVQHLYTDKNDCSLPIPDFYAFKYVVAMMVKKGRDIATIDLPGCFFLQTK